MGRAIAFINAIALHLAILCTLTSSTSLAFHPVNIPHFQTRPFRTSSPSLPSLPSTQTTTHGRFSTSLYAIREKKTQLKPISSLSQTGKRPRYRFLPRIQSKKFSSSKYSNNSSNFFSASTSSTTETTTAHQNHAPMPRKNPLHMNMKMDMPTILDMDMPTMKEMMSNRTDFEMAVMSTLAITVPIGIIATLALTGEESSASFAKSSQEFTRDLLSLWSLDPSDVRVTGAVTVLTEDGIDLLEDGIESLEALSVNVFDAAVPTTATDMISIALGEGIAAGIGSVVTAIVGTIATTKGFLQNMFQKEAMAGVEFEGLFAGAVANADYFVTRAAATPLLGAVGLPPFLSVVVATIPSQLVKLSSRQKEQRAMEDMYMEALLREEKIRKEKEKNPLLFMQKQLLREKTKKKLSSPVDSEAAITAMNIEGKAIAPSTLTKASDMNVTPGVANQIDFVEIFGDITKWLEYEVLLNELGGTLILNNVPISSGFESAIFGFLASLSSQLYSDIIYRYFDAGSEYNREASRARGPVNTALLYLVGCLSSATLFGVYESSRAPISNFITNLLSGGVDSCLGSENFDLCIETFFVDNAPDATVEGQVRAFFVAAMNLFERFEAGNIDDSVEFTRSVLVQLNSLLHFA